MVRPEGKVDPLDTTCFCPHCLDRFQRETGIALPREAASAPRAAEWVFAHQREAWIHWRAGLITSWVRDLAGEARRIAPHTIVGVHMVPWGPGEYDDGLMRVAGQDVEGLARFVDYLSPMCYAHMLYRQPSWVGRVVRELAERVDVSVLPSIEVKESYRSDELTDTFFTDALQAALRPPAQGVVFWSWPPLAASASKREILAGLGR
jgi:hypothetical protein